MSAIPIRRALIAVYDKTGIAEFAKALVEAFDIEIISTGGTAKHLKDAGVPVTMVEEVTGFPELLDGRVKTLHPKIHAGILADRDNPEHMRQLEEHGIKPIDMVVVNLYPFEETVKDPDCKFEDAIEMIDIGGPCMLRAAAKNHKHVLVVDAIDTYEAIIRALKKNDSELLSAYQRGAAHRTFAMTCLYDQKVSDWISSHAEIAHGSFKLIQFIDEHATKYGENPHQQGALKSLPADSDFRRLAASVGDVQMSFNNYVDADAALALCAELARSAQQLSPGSALWHRFATGGDEGVDDRVTDERHNRRNLPHIQKPGATYFVTFTVKTGELSPEERYLVMDACTYWHGEKATVHAVVVMPDHVHLLLTPHSANPEAVVPLGEIMHSIKRFSAREINKRRGVTGAFWQDEYFDRVMRNETEFRETWEYMEANPVTAHLRDAEGYRWFWSSDTGFMEVHSAEHRLQTGATARAEDCNELAACVFIKHTNACGVGISDDPKEAYRQAYLGDPNAAMGGILAVNFTVDRAFAETVMATLQLFKDDAIAGGCANPPQAFFAEVIVAPGYDEDAIEVIRTAKKWGERVRLLDVGDMTRSPSPEDKDYKRIAGGLLMQTPDLLGLNEDDWKIATDKQPSDSELNDARLAWLTCKHTKSNAITICKDGMLIGNGAGQMSRVMSCRIATWLAKENGHAAKLAGSVAASDAFFPFRDGLDILADAGVTTVIQPGGSKRDEEVIAAANERGIAMILTGVRHFKH